MHTLEDQSSVGWLFLRNGGFDGCWGGRAVSEAKSSDVQVDGKLRRHCGSTETSEVLATKR